jgi:hypothetical protein
MALHLAGHQKKKKKHHPAPVAYLGAMSASPKAAAAAAAAASKPFWATTGPALQSAAFNTARHSMTSIRCIMTMSCTIIRRSL